jgi:hypothetical protein
MKNLLTEELQGLIALVNETCDCDILAGGRKRKDVDGRMIFAQVLWIKGMTKSDIGRILNKDHASVVYYIRKVESYMKHDAILRQRYSFVLDSFLPPATRHNKYNYSRFDLLQEVMRLEEELVKQKEKTEAMSDIARRNYREDARLSGIYKIIKDRIPLGLEHEVERKLIHILNVGEEGLTPRRP